MAQGAVALPPTNGVVLTPAELREILEYEKIVQFRDQIFAGTHPRIKIPALLTGKQVNTARNVHSPSSSTPRPNTSGQQDYSTPNPHAENSTPFYNKSFSNQRSAGSAHIPISSKSEINPILLEKSDELKKAEIQLQRQRLERSLREQIEQQRIAAKALLQTSESLPNFDLSEVLSKALAIVHPSTTAEAEPSAGARSSASDSFDENTFYSSQHDTPEPSPPSQARKESVEVQSHNLLSGSERRGELIPVAGRIEDRDVVMTGASLSQSNQPAAQSDYQSPDSITQQQNAIPGFSEHGVETINSDSGSSAGVERRAQPSGARPLFDQAMPRQEYENVASPTVIRNHNLSPIAPQPARVSPLATARDPPILRETAPTDEVQPAQVSALRNELTGISSTDSSPKGGKGPEKKKKEKKKKRKAKDSMDTPDSPYIKPEPKSPSPYGVAPLPRPQKRQRQSGQYAAELNYDEPRYEPEGAMQERIREPFKEVRALRPYERVERYEPEVRRPEPAYRPVEEDGYRRVERVEDDYARVSGGATRRVVSPEFSVPYATRNGRPIRAASHAVVERRVYEEPRYYREPVMRASVRPDADRERSRSPIRERASPVFMRPPPQPVRMIIKVDEHGREYYEEMPPPMAPPSRYGDNVVYERGPVRTIPSRAPIEIYEDDGVVYQNPARASVAPRRVVTQPEYALPPQPDYRSYRQREYSVHPSAPPGQEYIQVRGPERRQMSHFEEPPREYVRAPSVRPEAVRYEVPPREYRMQSVRPEAPPREYAASVRPEARREMIQQPQREYSVRPEAVRRDGMVPEGERYYDEVPARRQADVAFIERPRAREASVVVYADDVRREVYR